MDTVQYLSVNLLLELPVFLVALIGCVLALVYWRRRPSASALTLCALLLYFLQAVIGLALYGLLPSALERQGWHTSSLITAMRAVHLIQSVAIAVSLVLLLAAVFRRDRGAQPATS